MVSLYLESEWLLCVGYPNQDVIDRRFRGPLRPRFSILHTLNESRIQSSFGRKAGGASQQFGERAAYRPRTAA